MKFQVQIELDQAELAEQELLVTITGSDEESKQDPARLVELSHDFDVVLARVGKKDKRLEYIIRRRWLTALPMTLEELSKKLKVSRERVRQLEFKALRLLRQYGIWMGLADRKISSTPSTLQPGWVK